MPPCRSGGTSASCAGVSQLAVLAVVLLVGACLLGNLFTAMDRRGFLPDLGFLGQARRLRDRRARHPVRALGHVRARRSSWASSTRSWSAPWASSWPRCWACSSASPGSRGNWLVNRLALAYVELFRNTPLLVQLFVIYFVVFLQLPPVARRHRAAADPCTSTSAASSCRARSWRRTAARGSSSSLVARRAGRRCRGGWPAAARPPAGRPLGLRWLALLAPRRLPAARLAPRRRRPARPSSCPSWATSTSAAACSFSPEFAALIVGLVLYTAAFIAEIVRGGIEAVSKGQREAARAIGLREGQTLRLVVLPQALRIIIPPLTSQYLNLIKNSSLAIAIGYAGPVQRQPHRLQADGPARRRHRPRHGRLPGHQPRSPRWS